MYSLNLKTLLEAVALTTCLLFISAQLEGKGSSLAQTSHKLNNNLTLVFGQKSIALHESGLSTK